MLVRLGIDAELADHRLDPRREHREQVDGRGVAVARAAEGLAVEGEVVAEVGASLDDPPTQDGLDGLDVESPKEAGEGGHRWRRAASEAEGVGEGRVVVASEAGDAGQAGAAGEDGDDGQ